MTTAAWTTVFCDALGFSRYFVDTESTKWAILAELEEDLIKFDLLRVPATAGPAQLFTLAVDDPIWEAIQEPTMSAAPLVDFIADVLEALKIKKPSFVTAPTKTTLNLVFKETHYFKLTASLQFTAREEVSSSVACLLLRQARIHDAAKQAKPALPTPVVGSSSSAKFADVAPLATSSTETVLSSCETESKEKEVIRVMVPVPKVPRGKNPTGIHFGSKTATTKKL